MAKAWNPSYSPLPPPYALSCQRGPPPTPNVGELTGVLSAAVFAGIMRRGYAEGAPRCVNTTSQSLPSQVHTCARTPDLALLDYRTQRGYVKHFFGFENTLGGIFSIIGEDFEKVGGFPNFWTWGYEDNVIQNKILKNGTLVIDRSNFYPIFDHKIVHMTDSLKRIINLNQVTDKDITIESSNNLWSICDLQYKIIENMIYVTNFDIVLPYTEKIDKYEMKLTDNPKNIEKLKRKFVNGNTMRMRMNFL